MQKKYLVAVLMVATQLAYANNENQKNDADTTDITTLQDVEIVAGRVGKTTPVAVTTVSKSQLNRENHGQDLPHMLNMLPGVTTTSDAGAGVGYTTIRVRGIDPSRINITLNGIPMNDAESHQHYWVNTGDLASSLNDIQIQRGAGSSTNGAGAFGASLNMSSDRSSMNAYAQFSGSYGSFNTSKATVRFGTGLLNDHWTFDGRISNIMSDGFIDRGNVHLQSFFTQTGFYAGQTSVKLLVFGGKEKTYHAWNYSSQDNIEKYGYKYNSCGLMYTDAQGVEHYYDDQTDNYKQLHTQLLANHTFNAQWKMNAAFHYTRGDGYYEEYKIGRKLNEYGLQTWKDENGTVQKKSDLVRRKQMGNDFVGQMVNAEYNANRLHLQFGEAYNYYNGDHYGNVIWVKNYTAGDLLPNHKYYDNNAFKHDFNVYVKGDYRITKGLSAYADLQYRHVRYRILGPSDNWDYNNGCMQKLDIDDSFNFFNPKAGLNWQIDAKNRLFASYAWVSKEPYRNCYTDGHLGADGQLAVYPKAEHMHDLELGYEYRANRLMLGANFYYMNYKDQLVLTGEVNEIGEPLTANMDKSYRLGIELQGAWDATDWFTWTTNLTWSRNRVVDFTEVIYDDETYEETRIDLGDTPISMSPDWIFGNCFNFHHRGFMAEWQTKVVSKQYMSNTGREEHALKAYCVNNIRLSYTFKPKKVVKEIVLGVDLNNLFDKPYFTNGYVASGMYKGKRWDDAYYSVQAGFHALGHVSLTF